MGFETRALTAAAADCIRLLPRQLAEMTCKARAKQTRQVFHSPSSCCRSLDLLLSRRLIAPGPDGLSTPSSNSSCASLGSPPAGSSKIAINSVVCSSLASAKRWWRTQAFLSTALRPCRPIAMPKECWAEGLRGRGKPCAPTTACADCTTRCPAWF